MYSSARKTHYMTIAELLIQDGLGKIRFFEETFLLVNTSMDVVLGMPFLSLSIADVSFDTRNLTWRTYSIIKLLPTIRRVELIDKHEFTRADFNKNSETFVVHVVALEALELAIYPFRAPLPAVLQQDKAPTEILSEYVDYANVFSPDLAIKLRKNTGINELAIELVEGK